MDLQNLNNFGIPKQEENHKSKKTLVVFVLVVVLGAGAYLYYMLNSGVRDKIVEVEDTNIRRDVDYVDYESLPSGLPADLPIEPNAVIIGNEVVNVQSPNLPKETQYVRSYISKKTLEENYDIYKKYLEDNKWKITTSMKEKAFAMLLAFNGDTKSRMKVDISKNTITGDLMVSVILIKNE